MTTATDSREQIKNDLCNYLTNTANVSDREILKKAVNLIKRIAEDWAITTDEDITIALSGSFGDRHHRFLKSIISRLQAIQEAEWQVEQDAEDNINQSLEDQRYNLFKDEYEYEWVEGEVIVAEDRIEVYAIGFIEGFKDHLPSSKKYMGKGCWHIPLTDKNRKFFGIGEQMTWGKCPILFYPNCK